ncbi:MAP1-LC3 domain-containing protein [Tieghemostelium lacteum]|uniref:Autophagy-related protein n=1 Tax=Tieghemostelium lacteum TaxID=361077 RepID=A0A152A9X1_TIELA|nr:MAP1-LC3 domain-containing protein [Tieghemostelium lacteum]|eukprot:KYR03022.1 MAP1-LC3 domain-containing protein [Tieghemostelium lacteum]
MTIITKSFKNEYNLEKRKQLSAKIRNRYRDRIPIIVERAANSDIPDLNKKKYLAQSEMTLEKFITEIRKHFSEETKTNVSKVALFLFVNKSNLPPSSTLISTIYEKYKDEDGFLYITYSGENTFG